MKVNKLKTKLIVLLTVLSTIFSFAQTDCELRWSRFTKDIDITTDIGKALVATIDENPETITSWWVFDIVGENALRTNLDELNFVTAYLKTNSKTPEALVDEIKNIGGYVKWKKQNEIPIEYIEKAEELINALKQVEPSVTLHLKDFSSAIGGKMEGLEYKLKTVESLSRKLFANGINATMYDILRYTTSIEEVNFFDGVFSMVRLLQENNYTVDWVSNTFVEGAIYKGINTTFTTPSGKVFELQFHTPKSFNVKQNVNHSLYEEWRKLDPTSSRAIELESEMKSNSSSVSHPKDVSIITAEALNSVDLNSKLNIPSFKLLKDNVATLNNLLKDEFIADFSDATVSVLKTLQEEGLFNVWKNDIRSNNIDELRNYLSKGNLRGEYIEVVESLKNEVDKLLALGKSKLEIAKTMNERRRQITTKYKGATPDDLLEHIFDFNNKRYTENGWGDKWGQTWEGALKRQKDLKGLDPGDDAYDNIIKGASTPLGTKEQLGAALYKTLGNDVLPVLKKYRMY